MTSDDKSDTYLATGERVRQFVTVAPDESGKRPESRVHEVIGRDGEVIHFNGALLGYATSFTERHSHATQHPADMSRMIYARKKTRCPACRWFEVNIYAVQEEGEPRYLVHTAGRTVVPDEIDYARVVWTDSAFEIIELLTVRPQGQPFLPAPSGRALAQAASHDDQIRSAYVNRVVA